MSNPKVQVPWEPLDWWLETIGTLALIFIWVYPLFYFGRLPEEVPLHFNSRGEADNYWDKFGIWVIPAIAMGTYLLLWFLNKAPHLFNYPAKITPENAFRQYQMATRILRIINVLTVSFFAYIVYEVIEISLGHNDSLDQRLTFIYIGALLIIPLGYLVMNWDRHKG